MKKKSFVWLLPDEGTLHHHFDRVNYLSYLLKCYELNRCPSPIGGDWEHINEMSPHPPAQSDHNYDNWSNGEYGNNSDDCDIDSGWFKKIKQLSLIQF